MNHRERAEKLMRLLQVWNPAHPKGRDHGMNLVTTAFAEVEAESLREIGQGMGVEFDDERLGYVSVQIDRDIYDKITRTLKGMP
jgi:hypothetical protein